MVHVESFLSNFRGKMIVTVSVMPDQQVLLSARQKTYCFDNTSSRATMGLSRPRRDKQQRADNAQRYLPQHARAVILPDSARYLSRIFAQLGRSYARTDFNAQGNY